MGFEFYTVFGLFIFCLLLGVAGLLLGNILYYRCKKPRSIKTQNNKEDGNIFFALFGAIALVGILGAGVMTFMKGPLATSVRLTRQNTAETQMALGAQVAVMAAANTASSGDCDSDGYVEPLEWRDAGASPKPTGGGLVPMSIGMTKKDPWGTEYGYCAWDYGTFGAVGCGGGTEKRLQGASASGAYPVVALVSAGSDKVFTTTCRTFAAADVNTDGDLLDPVDLPLVSKAAETDDDIIFTYTYDEATGASGGLWSIKSGDPGTAVIGKNIETTGTANLQGGVLLPDSSLITCDPTTAGIMARNTAGTGVDICDGTGWTSISGGGASDVFNNDNSVPCNGTTIGQVRYNTTSQLPEFCDGAAWRPFTLASQTANLVLTPSQQNSMNVDGANNLDTTNCTGGWSCGAPIVFTLQNQGSALSASISVSLVGSYTANFLILGNSCTIAGGNPDGKLSAMESCTITVKPKANGNMTYTTDLRVFANNNPIAIMQGTAAGFGCTPGRVGGGGIYVACNQNDGDGQGPYDLVIMPGGCSGTTLNPTCAGSDTGAVVRAWGPLGFNLEQSCDGDVVNVCKGAQQAVDIIAAQTMGYGSFPSATYCDDMIYNGKSDWFLPNMYQMQSLVYPQRAVISGLVNTWYATGNEIDANRQYYVNPLSGSTTDGQKNAGPYVRCVRRDNIPLPQATADTDPTNVGIVPQVTYVAGDTATSNTVTVTGILQTISVSISGGTGLNILKNGASTGSSSISGVKANDTLAFQMTGPSLIGTKATATITIGSDTYPWWVGYADSSRVAHAFVTSQDFNAAFGGLSAADSLCSNAAAASGLGLSSSWKAMLSDSSVSLGDRIPWNWGVLKTVTDQTISDGGYNDLFDGSLDGPINISETGSVKSAYVFTGSDHFGRKFGGNGYLTPNGWNLDWTYCDAFNVVGISSSTSTTAFKVSDGYCGNRALYCIENTDDTSDSTPASIIVPYKIQVPNSSRQSSSSVKIAAMSPGATTTLSVSATGGNPKFTVNGGAEVASGSVKNGDSIVFLMDSPATDNSNNKMTITAGGSTTLGYWRVWTGDSTGSVVKRVFVTSGTYQGNLGGVVGADTKCQAAASGAGLGGTWKAVLSGITEPEYAVNRVGYGWSFLRLVDGTTDVVTSGNLWNTNSAPLINPITKTQSGVSVTGYYVFSNTLSSGLAYSTTSSITNCNNYGGVPYYSGPHAGLNSMTTKNWIDDTAGNYNLCDSNGHLYCIEQ